MIFRILFEILICLTFYIDTLWLLLIMMKISLCILLQSLVLSCDAALEKQLLRVRQEIYSPTPKSRLRFDPNISLENIYENKKTVTVRDSAELDGDWKSDSANSEYSWDGLNNDIRDIKNECHDEGCGIYTPEEKDLENERTPPKPMNTIENTGSKMHSYEISLSFLR